MYVDDVFDIVVHVVKGLTELSHLITEPVFPLNVSNPLFEPEQTLAPPLTEPPTEVGSIITVVADEFAFEQLPLWTTALN